MVTICFHKYHKNTISRKKTRTRFKLIKIIHTLLQSQCLATTSKTMLDEQQLGRYRKLAGLALKAPKWLFLLLFLIPLLIMDIRLVLVLWIRRIIIHSWQLPMCYSSNTIFRPRRIPLILSSTPSKDIPSRHGQQQERESSRQLLYWMIQEKRGLLVHSLLTSLILSELNSKWVELSWVDYVTFSFCF